MKKILIVANLAGFASFLISDMEILSKMGYEIHFAANCNVLPWEDTKEKLKKLNVKIINIDLDSRNPISMKNIKAYSEIKKILKKEEYELIHCHTPIPSFIVRIAAKNLRKKNTKLIYTTHGFTFNKYSSYKSWILYYNIEKLMSKYTDAIITINTEDFNNAKKMKCKNVYYINGVGVDTNKFFKTKINKDEYRKKLEIDSEKILILSVGELSNRKNHQAIIKAISNLEDKNRYVYAICGNGINGGTGELLKKLAEKLNVNLKLLGFRKDIPEIIKCSDIGAIPSIREGLGLAGIQSLACGIPLISSDIQGINDYVIDNETGFKCNINDIAQISEAIKKLSDKEIRVDMREKCFKMSKKFDINVTKKQIQKIYEDILCGGKYND